MFVSYDTSQWVQSRLVKILYLYDWICLLESGLFDLEKRSCQLFYYCVHMAEKTTPLCYVSFYVRCSVLHLGYVSFYVRCSVLDLLTRGSRVLCTCTADIVLHAVQSVFGCACARNFLLWNCFLHELFRIFRVLAYFASALLRPLFTEYYSMTGELTRSL